MAFINSARLHRFKDLVAIALEGAGETFYIPTALAKEIGVQLIACAEDTKTKDFLDEGTYPTTLIFENGDSVTEASHRCALMRRIENLTP